MRRFQVRILTGSPLFLREAGPSVCFFVGLRPFFGRGYENNRIMSKVCTLTGKRPIAGNNVSHSNRRTKRRFIPNMQSKKFFVPELGKFITLTVSANAMRTVNKLGLVAYVKKLERKGIDTGIKLK